MLFGKGKKRSIYSDNIDAAKMCATCKFGRELLNAEDVVCQKHGIVSKKHCCKSYDYNRLLKRPPKKRTTASSFTQDDFSID